MRVERKISRVNARRPEDAETNMLMPWTAAMARVESAFVPMTRSADAKMVVLLLPWNLLPSWMTHQKLPHHPRKNQPAVSMIFNENAVPLAFARAFTPMRLTVKTIKVVCVFAVTTKYVDAYRTPQ